MDPVTHPLTLHPGEDGGPGPFSPEWVTADLVPFLVAFLAVGVGGSVLLFVVLYAYERLRFDHRASVSRAFSVLWVAAYLFVVGIVFGGGWDKKYHARTPFESFYSAPHLFVYASVGAATLLVVCLVVYYGPLFGSRTGLPYGGSRTRCPYGIPAALGLLVTGLGLTAFGGLVLDNTWHSLFGLNETPFSTPHMTIDWGKLVTLLGFGAAAAALSRHRAVPGRHRPVVAYLVVVFSVVPFTGPFGQQLTVEQVQGVLATLEHPESGLARAFAVLEEWHLVRTNPVSVVLGGVWAGSVLGFLGPYLGRARALLGVVGVFTFLRARNNLRSARALGVPVDGPAAWLPLPLMVAVVAFVVGDRLGADDRVRWFVAGGAFSLVTALVWSPTVPGLVVAAPVATVAFVLARRLGEGAHALVERPTRRRIGRVAAVAVVVPVTTGAVDLVLRVTMGGAG